MAKSKTDYSKKFASQLGTVTEFVSYVRNLEKNNKLALLGDFRGLDGQRTGKRYLLTKKGGVVDFRHFFAAMNQRLEGTHNKKINIGPTSEGTTLLLGLLNEVGQCVDEGVKRKLNSCFSKEDMISNRLGARFGENIVIKRSQASQKSVADLLATYLASLGPMPVSDIQKLKMPTSGDVFLESVGAVLKSLSDMLVPSAY